MATNKMSYRVFYFTHYPKLISRIVAMEAKVLKIRYFSLILDDRVVILRVSLK